MDLDLQQYMGAYIDGAKENLDTMDRMLLAMEQNPNNGEIIEEIFRATHTLKGMSATMGFEKIAHLTHEMENVLDKLRNHQIAVTSQVIDTIFETFDVLRTLVNDSINQSDSGIDPSAMAAKLNAISSGQASTSSPGGTADYGTTQPPSQEGDGGNISTSSAAELAPFQLSDFEESGLLDAQQRGTPPYLVKVNLVSNCLLKGPRIFMILRSLDSLHCEIFKSLPEVKDLENEKFDRSFMMIVTTDHKPQEIADAIESISEIETVEVIPIFPASNVSEEVFKQTIQPQANTQNSSVKQTTSSRGSAASQVTQTQSQTKIAQPPSPTNQPQVATASAPSSSSPSTTPTVQSGGSNFKPAPAGQISQDEKPIQDESEKNQASVELIQLVSFQMAGEVYALDIKEVEGIINMPPITRVPKSPAHIEGVINLRGEILPVINLRRRLKQAEKELTHDDQIIILSFKSEKVKVGFLVDRVQEVLRLPQTAIEPPSHVSEGVNVEHLRGVGKLGNRIIILLNAEKIVFG